MSENKFLKNLQQPRPSASPVVSSPPPADPAPVAPGHGYDPIQRLVEELSRHNQAIEGLNRRFDVWEKQPRGASTEELQRLVEAARAGTRIQVNTELLATKLLPELTKGMPTPTNLKTATDEGVAELRAVGLATAERIEQAASAAAHRIEWASRSKANVWANRIGFTSWQSALVVLSLLVVIGAGLVIYVQSHQQDVQAMRVQDNASKEFVSWIQEKYPQVWKAYLRKVNP
ncbi:hypothetical protein [Spirosoma koreense]